MGRIPHSVKSTLEYTGYLNAALGDIGDDEITNIEQDVKNISTTTAPKELLKCFEKFGNQLKDFRFLAGERAILKLLAATVKRRGINHFFRKERKAANSIATIPGLPTAKVQMEQDMDHASLIRQRVIKYYQTRYNALRVSI